MRLVTRRIRLGGLVAREVEAAGACQVIEQRVEVRTARSCRSASALGHQRVISASAIWSRGSTKSTAPASIAAPGMPKKSRGRLVLRDHDAAPALDRLDAERAVGAGPRQHDRDRHDCRSSPPRTRTAGPPTVARSAPARCGSATATRRRRPADGGRAGRRRPRPARSAAPSSACVTGRAQLRPRISASMLRWWGSMCCTMATPAGKSAGSSESTDVSALRPPADAAISTASVAARSG